MIISEATISPVVERPLPKGQWTDVKVQRVSLYALSILTLGAGSALALLCSSPLSFAAIPLFVASVALSCWAYKTKDYDDPAEVAQMRKRALEKTFLENVQEHYDLDHLGKVLPSPVIQQQFEEAHQGLSLSHLSRDYPLSTLITHQLLSPEKLRDLFLQELAPLTVFQFHERFSPNATFQYFLPNEVHLSSLKTLWDDVAKIKRKTAPKRRMQWKTWSAGDVQKATSLQQRFQEIKKALSADDCRDREGALFLDHSCTSLERLS